MKTLRERWNLFLLSTSREMSDYWDYMVCRRAVKKGKKAYKRFYQQQFSLPNVLINYILFNQKEPLDLLKLYFCCKHFFFKAKIIVAKWYRTSLFFDDGELRYGYRQKFLINYKKYSIWLTDTLVINNYNFNEGLPKIYRSSNAYLSIWDSQMSFDEFNRICESGFFVYISMIGSTLYYSDGQIVPPNVLHQNFPDTTINYNPHEEM